MNTTTVIKCNAEIYLAADYKIKCTYVPRRLTSASSVVSVDNETDEATLEDKAAEGKEFETVLPKYTRK